MPLPPFSVAGDLPEGIHRASLLETLSLFGQGSPERTVIGGRLKRVYSLVESTGFARRFIVFGSFVTSKLQPNDVDIFLLMDDSFDLTMVTGEAAFVFHHLDAQSHFGASVFWTRPSGAFGGEAAMVEAWQIRREGGRRGIVEIVSEDSP